MRTGRRKNTSAVPEEDERLRKKINSKAYERFVRRGRIHGYHMDDWLAAEKEVLAERTPKMTPRIPRRASQAKIPSRAKNPSEKRP